MTENAENAQLVATRKVLVYTTTGKNAQEITTDSKIWSELKSALSNNSVVHSGMKAVVGETKVTLESPNAELPTGNFTLFLMPKKTKSGNNYKDMPYKECRSAIKIIIDNADDVEKAKEFFSVNGKNYTQTKTDEMRKNLAKWEKKYGITSTVASGSNKGEWEMTEVPAKEKEVIKPKQNKINFDIVLDVKVSDMTKEEQKEFDRITIELQLLLNSYAERIEKEKEEQEAKEKVEKQKANLSAQAKDLAKDFDDVNYW